MLYIVYGGDWTTPYPIFHKPLDKLIEVIELGIDLVQLLKNVGASIY